MKSRIIHFFAYVFLLFFVWSAGIKLHAQTVVRASIDTASILIGEQVQVTIKCNTSARSQVAFPAFNPMQEIMPGVEFVNCTNTDTVFSNGGQRMELTKRYTITSFDSALYALPPFEVTVDGAKVLSKGSVGLKVNTIPVDTVHVDQIRAPHGVVNQPFEWEWKRLALVLSIWAFAALALLAWIRYTDPRLITRKVVIHPPVPAHITALSNIQKMEAEKNDADLKEYYMELTNTLRRYIQQRFGFNAREMTTSEIIGKLTLSHNKQALNELKEVLTQADLVKFAKLAPSKDDRNHNLMQALDYVQSTKPEAEQNEAPRVAYLSLTDEKQSKVRMAILLGAAFSTLAMAILLVLANID